MDARIELEGQAAAPGRSRPGAAEAAVVKKLARGAAATQRLLARFGVALVCVGYREDAARNHRSTAVGPAVDERPGKPAASLVRIDYQETSLRQQVKAPGGGWDATRKLRSLPRTAVRRLGLKDRVVPGDG